jgi:hypothetical protein
MWVANRRRRRFQIIPRYGFRRGLRLEPGNARGIVIQRSRSTLDFSQRWSERFGRRCLGHRI